MLTNAAEEAVENLFWLHDTAADRGGTGYVGLLWLLLSQDSFARMLLYAGIWLAYVLGAVGGVWAETRVGVLALAGPLAGLALLVLWDLVHPLQQGEPRQQPDWRT
jgi:hypothetical protein